MGTLLSKRLVFFFFLAAFLFGTLTVFSAVPQGVEVTNDSLLEAMKYAFSGGSIKYFATIVAWIAAFFWLLAVIMTYHEATDGSNRPINTKRIFHLVGILGLIIMYKPIVYDVLDPFMKAINQTVSSEFDEILTNDTLSSRLLTPPDAGLFSGGEKWINSMLCSLLNKVDHFFQYIFNIYVDICLQFTLLFGIIFLAFSLFPPFIGFLKTWITLVLKYYCYFFVMSVGIAVCNAFVNFFISKTGGSLIPAEKWIDIAFISLFFKIGFNLIGFKICDNVFAGQAQGAGIGSMVNSLVRNTIDLTKMIRR